MQNRKYANKYFKWLAWALRSFVCLPKPHNGNITAFKWVSKKIRECISFALLRFFLLVKKPKAVLSINQRKKLNNHDLLAFVFIHAWLQLHVFASRYDGSLDCLRLLWSNKVITLVLVLRHSIENFLRSDKDQSRFEYNKYTHQALVIQ